MVEGRDRIRVAFDAHVVGRRRTGNERYAVELATALATRDDVELLAYLDRGRAWPGTWVDGMQRRDLHIAWPQLRIPYELPLRARRDRADLLHVQYVTPPIAGLPVVTLISDLSFEDLADAFPRRTTLRLRMTIRVAARRSTVVLAPSEFTRQRLISTYGLDPDRVHLTPLGVSDGWHPLRLDDAYRRVAGMRLPESFVLAVGTMHPRKNMPRLVRAVAEARRRGAGDLALVIAGASGWQSTAVDEAVDAVAGDRWVRRVGHVSDETLAALYRVARVVAYPSLYEGFGLPILEALASGAIVVASARTSIPESAGDAAVLVDPTDTSALAEAICRAATEVHLRERLAEAGPRQAARFSWAASADATVRAYRAALAR